MCGLVRRPGVKSERLFMSNARSISGTVLVYFFVIGGLLIFAAIGMASVVRTTTALSQRSERDKSLLELRLKNAREIRQALARPIASVEPLPPIKTKVEEGDTHASKSNRPQLTQRARDVFASRTVNLPRPMHRPPFRLNGIPPTFNA
jgi:hypothetical protein